MDILELIRIDQDAYRTLGVLLVNEVFTCLTLEPPWRHNKHNASCILKGKYNFEVYESSKFKTPCLSLFNVPGREFISIHYGNWPIETNGCILVGSEISKNSILNSKTSLSTLIKALKFKEGFIVIR